METAPRTRRLKLRRAALMAGLAALLVPATAGAAVKPPVVTKVAPKRVAVGETLTVFGQHFRRGRNRNTVLFKRDGGKARFVKARLATNKRIMVVIPASLEKFMAVSAVGGPAPTRFRLRVLTTKLSRRFTSLKGSPVIAPRPRATGSETPPPDSAPACPAGADDDDDGLSSALEETLKTDPCNPDTDGDGVSDGFEYRSALDLNQDEYGDRGSVPYPGKRGYPNPLDVSDASTDYDGDWLTLEQEYNLWRYSVSQGASASLDSLSYSDGLKYSIYKWVGGHRVGDLPATNYDKQIDFENWLAGSRFRSIEWPGGLGTYSLLDVNHDRSLELAAGQRWSESIRYDMHGLTSAKAPDGVLSDDERDEDADGLSNIDEASYRMSPTWWEGMYSSETPFSPIAFAGTDPADPDTDGDGTRDGADDQDHDNVPNLDELSRNMASGRPIQGKAGAPSVLSPAGRVNPFNPCLPFTDSGICPTYTPLNGSPWAPFTDDGIPDPAYVVLN
jgi:hypothetical protein